MKTIKSNKLLISLAVVVLFCISTSCSFYRVVPLTDYTSNAISDYESTGKYLVLKRGAEAWQMYDVQVKGDSISARLDIRLGYNVNHLDPKTKGVNHFSRKQEPAVEYTVHLFTNDSTFNTFDTLITIHESSIYRMDEFNYARAPSRASIIVPIVMAPVAVMVMLGVATANTINDWSASGNTSFRIK